MLIYAFSGYEPNNIDKEEIWDMSCWVFFSCFFFNTFYEVISMSETWKEMFYLTKHSTHFIYSFMAYGKGPHI